MMRRAIDLARKGRGHVEPNPLVGAVIVDRDGRFIAEGYHERFGGPHAEINALRAAGELAAAATMYITLEPCCHHGKTGPCTEAIIKARVARVVVGAIDPSPHAGGQGIAALRGAGIEVEIGLLERETARLVAPFVKRVTTGMPYVHAKWAMTLDGKTASRTGQSRWISNETSRRIVHRLRGLMDAIVVGSGTALADDPLLTARPAGPRTPARIVIDSQARLSPESQLVRTSSEAPVIVATTARASPEHRRRLEHRGVECLELDEEAGRVDLVALLEEIGRRQMTNILVEGGARLLGALFDRKLIDEVHVFIAPKVVGGSAAVTALAGEGLDIVPTLPQIEGPEIEIVDGDVYIHGPLSMACSAGAKPAAKRAE